MDRQDTDPALMSTFLIGRGSSMPDLTVLSTSEEIAKNCDDISGGFLKRTTVCYQLVGGGGGSNELARNY